MNAPDVVVVGFCDTSEGVLSLFLAIMGGHCASVPDERVSPDRRPRRKIGPGRHGPHTFLPVQNSGAKTPHRIMRSIRD